MSLIPSLINWEPPRHIWDQHFGLDLLPRAFNDLLPSHLINHHYCCPRRYVQRNEKCSTINATKDNFQACLDVQQFTPEEITVKIVNDAIIVEGKHEEKRDEYGYISRQFKRRYVVPKEYDISKVTSSLSSDGVLTLDAPKAVNDKEAERVIPIIRTASVHSFVEKSSEGEKNAKKMKTEN